MSKSTKGPPQELDEGDRLRIGHARAVLQEYGLYVDVAEMGDVAYERRQIRMKALDTVAGLAQHIPPHTEWVALAKLFEDYIWKGQGNGQEV